jgi:hypothetical protein
VCATFAGATPRARAEPPRVQVRGAARIDVHVSRAGSLEHSVLPDAHVTRDRASALSLSGVVTDEMGAPAAGTRITLSLRSRGGEPVDVSTPAPWMQSCGMPENALKQQDFARLDTAIALPSDAQARFCVRLSLAAGGYVAHFEATPLGLLDGASADVPIDFALKPVTLRFDPEPSTLSLDDEATWITAVATTETDGEVSAAPGLAIRMSNEADATLGTETTGGSGAARFRIPGGRLGGAGAGIGELRVDFAGNAELSPASRSARVERNTRVRVGAPADWRPGDIEFTPDGVAVRVAATTECAARGCPGSPTGSIELYHRDRLVGAAPLAGGVARVIVASRSDISEQDPIRVHYARDAPWFVPTGDVSLRIPAPPESPWVKLLSAFAALAVAGWLVATRWPLRSAGPGVEAVAEKLKPGIRIVRASAAAGTIRGRIFDAHDLRSIVGGRAWIERAGFERVEIVAHATSDADGRFELTVAGCRPGDAIVVESREHCALRQPFPAGGEIEVGLVLRRRELLERLVTWAQRRGGRFDARPEPTPAHVRAAAADEHEVASWADAVERAAYGSDVVDERIEQEVHRREPREPAALRHEPAALRREPAASRGGGGRSGPGRGRT